MGLILNEHGVWIVRIRVPGHLQEAVARLLDNGKDQQTWLQKSTRTKDRNEAKRIAVDVLERLLFHGITGLKEPDTV